MLSRTGDEDGPQAYHLWRTKGGTVTETPVTGVPADARDITVEDGDARSVILRYSSEDDGAVAGRWGMVDVAAGTFTRLPDRVDNGRGLGGSRASCSAPTPCCGWAWPLQDGCV